MENTISSSSNNPENSTTQYVRLSGENISQEQKVKVQVSYAINRQDAVVSKCGKNFTQKRSLNTHKKTHTDDKPFQCDVCSKTFDRAAYLKVHLRTHTGEKPFQCSLCSFCSAQAINLKRHEKTHAGEKPYKCKICLRPFPRLYNLQRHQYLVHSIEQPVICDGCEKKFKSTENLKRHKKRSCKKNKKTVSDKQVTSTEQSHTQVQMQTAENVIATGATPFYQYQPEETKNMEESVGFGQNQAASSTELPTPSMPSHKSSENLTRAQFIKMKKFREIETKDEVSLPVLSTLPMEQGSVDLTILENPQVEGNSEKPLDLSLPKTSQNSMPQTSQNSMPQTSQNSSFHRPWESSTSDATEDLNQGASASGNPAGYMLYQHIKTSPTDYRVQNSASFLC